MNDSTDGEQLPDALAAKIRARLQRIQREPQVSSVAGWAAAHRVFEQQDLSVVQTRAGLAHLRQALMRRLLEPDVPADVRLAVLALQAAAHDTLQSWYAEDLTEEQALSLLGAIVSAQD